MVMHLLVDVWELSLLNNFTVISLPFPLLVYVLKWRKHRSITVRNTACGKA